VYQWLVLVHLIGLVLFLLPHGASMFCAFRVRRETDPERVRLLLELSALGSQTSYLGLLLLVIGGLGAAWMQGWLLAGWVVASYVVLVGVVIAMYAVGASYYYRLRQAVAGADGQPPIGRDELVPLLRTRRPEALAAVGIAGLVVLVWLMVMKPF
jgi:uncharacterized membrane protein